MSTRSKRLILVAMIALMLSCVFVACNNDESVIVPPSSVLLQYSFDGNTDSYSIVACDKNVVEVNVPAEYNGYPVKRIDDNAFFECRSLISVTIPDSVMSIGEHAFGFCSALSNVTIPSSVTSIDKYAFIGCHALANVEIPDSVTEIGFSAFASTAWYNNQPDGVVYIGNLLYNYKGTMPNGTSITIKDGTKGISDYAFDRCSGLSNVTIPNSVTSIGTGAFSECIGIVSITIPDSVTSIGQNAFYGTEWYNKQPDGVIYVGEVLYEFKLSNLLTPYDTSITIKDGTKGISSHAFDWCSGLKSITIPNSVTDIGEYAFSGHNSLTSITVESGNPKYHSDGNCLIETDSKTLLAGCNTSVIPNDGSVTRIGSGAFFEHTKLSSITIPYGVTSIGDEAFKECTSLTNVIIPDSVKSIGDEAFKKCTSLTNVMIPDSVKSIGRGSFGYCTGMTSIELPDTIMSIGEYAFSSCGLTSITIPNGVISVREGTFYTCDGLTSVTIADSVVSIGYSAFYGCVALTSLSIGNGVKSIGENAFKNCSRLASLTIPDSVTSIGSSAFAGLNSLIHVTLPAFALNKLPLFTPVQTVVITSGDRILDYAFDELNHLTSITIPNSVKSIGSWAFNGCDSLTDVTFDGTKEQWLAIMKSSIWYGDSNHFIIHCTDGDLDKFQYRKNDI